MKKKLEQRKDFFHLETNSDFGILKNKDQSYLIYIIERKIIEKILGFFQLVIGQNLIFGII
jgi:hypothetical protein